MKTIIKTINIIVVLLVLVSCSKDNTTIVELDPVQEEPQGEVSLENIFPLEGPKETVVTVTGNNFGTDSEAVSIFINGKEMPILSIEDSEIQFEVLPKTFTGEVELRFSDQSFSPGIFEYEITTTVSTFAGSTEGHADGLGSEAKFYFPRDIVLDERGKLYVADHENHRIRDINSEGFVFTYTGSEEGFDNGNLSTATFNKPRGLFIDDQGSIYVADQGNDAIRKIDPNGNVFIAFQNFENESGGTDHIKAPFDYALDSKGNAYIVELVNNRILKRMSDGTVMAIGDGTPGHKDGPGASAQFIEPTALAIDANDNVYVVDNGNHKIRMIDENGVVSTVAGTVKGDQDGHISQAQFYYPSDITLDVHGNMYITDSGNHKIKKISAGGTVTTLAGNESGNNDGLGSDAQFGYPFGLVVNAEGTLLYVADTFNHRIRKIVME